VSPVDAIAQSLYFDLSVQRAIALFKNSIIESAIASTYWHNLKLISVRRSLFD
jgi:hypothetical protein